MLFVKYFFLTNILPFQTHVFLLLLKVDLYNMCMDQLLLSISTFLLRFRV